MDRARTMATALQPHQPAGRRRSACACLAVVAALLGIGGCATRLPEAGSLTDAAVLTVADANLSTDGVQLIVHSIDGTRPERAGPAPRSDGGSSRAGDYEPGTVVSQPPLRPGRWDFAVAPGSRRVSMIFAVPGSGLLNLAAVTRGRGSEATGVAIDVLPGCQYTLGAKLTVLSGRDYQPELRGVRPIPASYGVKPAGSCPAPRDVALRILRD